MSKSVLFIIILLFSIGQPELQAQNQSLASELDTLSNLTEIQFPSEDQPTEIRISSPVTFSDADLLIGRISGITSDRNGGVYIADEDQSTIHRFDSSGNYIRSIGRDGEGPGEFRSLVQINTDGNLLYGLDRNLNRITTFDPETGDPVETLTLGNTGQSLPETFHLLPDDAFLITFEMYAVGRSEEIHYKAAGILDKSGNYKPADQIRLPARESVMVNSEGGNIGIIVPTYSRRSRVSVSGSGSVYTNWSEHFLIKQYDSDGSYTGAYYSDLEGEPLTRSQLRNRYSSAYMDALRGETLPSAWPTVRSFLVDNRNRVWVNLFGDGAGEKEWLVFQENGEVDGMLTLPEESTIHEVWDDYLYLVETDSDGFEIVKRYEIE
ncbi:6-bladed beta-propeller [Rhodohalobacter sp. SW132]|uniref:6-bladed beta-propeller n=1 Tax=Rhodohalobacter sp. SW132 TaxID=2293433 RepID=UPI000E22D394|nr:6-bladed beta-propeller [Rhodohalobacter sp. SW132]REL33500.1 6-bladed beta-propeller [Rhodohalobacter sp. SW132]